MVQLALHQEKDPALQTKVVCRSIQYTALGQQVFIQSESKQFVMRFACRDAEFSEGACSSQWRVGY